MFVNLKLTERIYTTQKYILKTPVDVAVQHSYNNHVRISLSAEFDILRFLLC